MAVEIERKFLIRGDGWRTAVTASKSLHQSYLARTEILTARIRITDMTRAEITIKSAANELVRQEYEYPIPVEDARELMKLRLGRPVRKSRHLVPANPGTWEIDVFEGDNAGLILAEIELPDEAAEVVLPEWLGEEVTGDPRYYNSTLAGLSGLSGE